MIAGLAGWTADSDCSQRTKSQEGANAHLRAWLRHTSKIGSDPAPTGSRPLSADPSPDHRRTADSAPGFIAAEVAEIAAFVGTSFAYNDNGNLTSDEVRSYTWNARDQLTR